MGLRARAGHRVILACCQCGDGGSAIAIRRDAQGDVATADGQHPGSGEQVPGRAGDVGEGRAAGPGGTSWAQGALQVGHLTLGTPEAKLELLAPTARGLPDVTWDGFLA